MTNSCTHQNRQISIKVKTVSVGFLTAFSFVMRSLDMVLVVPSSLAANSINPQKYISFLTPVVLMVVLPLYSNSMASGSEAHFTAITSRPSFLAQAIWQSQLLLPCHSSRTFDGLAGSFLLSSMCLRNMISVLQFYDACGRLLQIHMRSRYSLLGKGISLIRKRTSTIQVYGA